MTASGYQRDRLTAYGLRLTAGTICGVSAPRLYCPNLRVSDSRVSVTGDDAHRLRQVLRLEPGAAIRLFDGRGHEWVGRIATVSKHAVEVSELETIDPVSEPRVRVTLACGVLKGDQMDAVVRDATMMGVAAIVPLRTAHVTVPPRAWQSGAARDRWQRVAIASATQCRRAVVPEVKPVTDYEAALREPADQRLICVEPGVPAAAGKWEPGPAPASLQLLIGPEGGWAEDEVARALAAGARALSLGPRTLRAETAPIVALTIVAAAWDWQTLWTSG